MSPGVAVLVADSQGHTVTTGSLEANHRGAVITLFNTERAPIMSYVPSHQAPAVAVVPPKKPRRWPWVVGAIVVLAAVSIGGAVLQHKPAAAGAPGNAASTTGTAPQVVASVTVPTDLVGRNAGDAKSELAQAGLLGNLVAASPACANTIQPPLGCLVTSVPDAGQQVDGGGTVQVVIDMESPTTAMRSGSPCTT